MSDEHIHYYGFFFEGKDFPASLAKRIAHPHVTFAYEPKEDFARFLGKSAWFKVVGYGNDGINEGWLVEAFILDAELAVLMDQRVSVPHITLSIGGEGKAVNTRYLDFKPVDKPHAFQGVFGGFTSDHRVIFEKN